MTDIKIVHGRLGSDIWVNVRLRIIMEMVKGKGNRILDLGCGPGYIGSSLSGDNEVIFSDMEKGNIAKLWGKRLLVDARHLPFRKGSFDYVVCGDMLEHVREDGLVLDEIRSLLKKDGKAIITVPAHSSIYGTHDRHMGHYRRYDRNKFIKFAKRHGFVVKRCRYANSLMFPPFLFSNIFLNQTKTYRGRSKKINRLTPLIGLAYKIEKNIRAPFGVSLIFEMRKNS